VGVEVDVGVMISDGPGVPVGPVPPAVLPLVGEPEDGGGGGVVPPVPVGPAPPLLPAELAAPTTRGWLRAAGRDAGDGLLCAFPLQLTEGCVGCARSYPQRDAWSGRNYNRAGDCIPGVQSARHHIRVVAGPGCSDLVQGAVVVRPILLLRADSEGVGGVVVTVLGGLQGSVVLEVIQHLLCPLADRLRSREPSGDSPAQPRSRFMA